VSIGHFLIGDGIGDGFFGHRESSFHGWVQSSFCLGWW
jgi:hypothetical protein